MAQIIQFRRGTAAQATAANPILAQGETGFETDTGKFKIGDGVSPWNALPYFSAGASFSLNPVATNAAKLALVGIAPGYHVQVTGEGNRVEQYIGGAINTDASWKIIGNNTVHLYLDAGYNFINTIGTGVVGSVTINEVDVSNPNGGVIDLGWVDPQNIPVGGNDNQGELTQGGAGGFCTTSSGFVPSFNGVMIGLPQDYGYAAPLLLGGFSNNNTGSAETGFAILPIPAPLRGSVTLVL